MGPGASANHTEIMGAFHKWIAQSRHTSSPCFSCSPADVAKARRVFAIDDVLFGMADHGRMDVEAEWGRAAKACNDEGIWCVQPK